MICDETSHILFGILFQEAAVLATTFAWRGGKLIAFVTLVALAKKVVKPLFATADELLLDG